MHGRPQPVPPIFAPEVAARAIVWAAEHAPRELEVGWPTVRAIWANKFFPGLLDRYLARFGYDAQQTDEPVQPDRRDNLTEPLPGDYGAAGRFVSRSRPMSRQLWLRTHVPELALAFALAALGLAAMGARSAGRISKRA